MAGPDDHSTVAGVIGIDLGATSSAVAAYDDGSPRVLPNAEGDRATPSVVGCTEDGTVVVGKRAADRLSTMPDRAVRSVVEPIERGDPVRLGDEVWAPERLLASLLGKLKRDAEAALEAPIAGAVVAVPAHFGVEQRTIITRAASMADLPIERIITDTTGAAIAYPGDGGEETIAVCDVGGRTTDVSVLDIDGGVYEVLATGTAAVGGTRWDDALVDELVEGGAAGRGGAVADDHQFRRRVRTAVEAARRDLSSRERARVRVPYVADGDGDRFDFEATIDRSTLRSLLEGSLDDVASTVTDAIAAADRSHTDVDAVLLIGGATRAPAVREGIERRLDRNTTRGVAVDEGPALGAAIQGAVLDDRVDDVVLLDTLPHPVGIECDDGTVEQFLEANATIPTGESHRFAVADPDARSATIRVIEEPDTASVPAATVGGATVSLPRSTDGPPTFEVSIGVDETGEVAATVDGREVPLRRDDPPEPTPDAPLPARPPRLARAVGLVGDGAAERLVPAGASLPIERTERVALPAGPAAATTVVNGDPGTGRDANRLGELAIPFADAERTVEMVVDVEIDREGTLRLTPRSTGATFVGDEPLEIEGETTADREPASGGPEPDRTAESNRAAEGGAVGRGTDGGAVAEDEATGESPVVDGAVAEELLTLRDDLERAVTAEASDVDGLRTGVELVLKRFDETLEAAGFDPIEPAGGSAVDPSRHRVVERVDAAASEGTVVDVERRGYERDGQVIRPASVTTSTGTDPWAASVDAVREATPVDQPGALEAYAVDLAADDGPAVAYVFPEAADHARDSAADRIDAWREVDGHEAVPAVLEYDLSDRPWIAVERPTGVPLGNWAADAPVAARLGVLAQLADALGYAHRHGSYHFDLHPDRVLVDPDADSLAAVRDWGLERVADETGEPRYVAPEQRDPDAYGAPDHRTDVYQLGALAYDVLTGTHPFDGDDGRRRLLASDRNSAVPARFDSPLARAFKEWPVDRYDSATAFADELRAAR